MLVWAKPSEHSVVTFTNSSTPKCFGTSQHGSSRWCKHNAMKHQYLYTVLCRNRELKLTSPVFSEENSHLQFASLINRTSSLTPNIVQFCSGVSLTWEHFSKAWSHANEGYFCSSLCWNIQYYSFVSPWNDFVSVDLV